MSFVLVLPRLHLPHPLFRLCILQIFQGTVNAIRSEVFDDLPVPSLLSRGWSAIQGSESSKDREPAPGWQVLCFKLKMIR